MDVRKSSILLLISPEYCDASGFMNQLAKFGFNVFSVSNLDNVINLYKNVKTGAIIVDLDMFNTLKDSIAVIKTAASSLKQFPLIVVSSQDDIKLKLRIFKFGVADYIIKPFDLRELYARLKLHIYKFQLLNSMEIKYVKLEKKNMSLEKMATVDALTGLYNKRYILERLCSEVSRSSRFKEPISFIMIDIDFFKKINDKYGHSTGDSLLSEIAVIIRTCIRNIDIPTRYGGEEFLIACPNTDSIGAYTIAERIRKKILLNKFYLKENVIKITLSFGIRSVVLKPEANISQLVSKLIDEADRALYRAKAKGRNRVEMYKDNDDVISSYIHNNVYYQLQEKQFNP